MYRSKVDGGKKLSEQVQLWWRDMLFLKYAKSSPKKNKNGNSFLK